MTSVLTWQKKTNKARTIIGEDKREKYKRGNKLKKQKN
jgi:hypothetical protein